MLGARDSPPAGMSMIVVGKGYSGQFTGHYLLATTYGSVWVDATIANYVVGGHDLDWL